MNQRTRINILERFAKAKRGNKQLLFALLKGKNHELVSFAQRFAKSLNETLAQHQVQFMDHPSIFLEPTFLKEVQSLFPQNKEICEVFFKPEMLCLFQQIYLDLMKLEQIRMEDDEMDRKEKIYIYGDLDYPKQLEPYSHSPLALYTSGKAASICWKHPLCMTIVGSRRPSAYGLAVTEDIVKACSSYGLPVLSGMALGIDRQVHEIALKLNQPTLAVLGNGVDICYPRQNIDLYQDLFHAGLLISEFVSGTRARREFFPARNRILSGLAHSVIVVEAAQKSGSLITASHASEQGKDVYAVPGNIYAKTSRGCNELIRDGAHIYTDVDHFLYSLEDEMLKFGIKKQNPNLKKVIEEKVMLNERENRMIDVLGKSPQSIQELFLQLHFPLNEVLEIITSLESKSYVETRLGLYYLTEVGLRSLCNHP